MHDKDEFRKRLGCGIQTPDGDLDALLDRVAPERSVAVARPSAHADGISPTAMLVHVLKLTKFSIQNKLKRSNK